MTTAHTSIDPATVATTVIEQLERAWNAADGAAFGAAFADESDFVTVRGEHHRGAEQIGHGHQAIFDTIYAGSSVRYELELARPLAHGSILAVAGATLEAPTGPLRGTNHARLTMIIVEEDDRWAVTGFHNTLVAPAPPR